jgi:hypothetical protein
MKNQARWQCDGLASIPIQQAREYCLSQWVAGGAVARRFDEDRALVRLGARSRQLIRDWSGKNVPDQPWNPEGTWVERQGKVVLWKDAE